MAFEGRATRSYDRGSDGRAVGPRAWDGLFLLLICIPAGGEMARGEWNFTAISWQGPRRSRVEWIWK